MAILKELLIGDCLLIETNSAQSTIFAIFRDSPKIHEDRWTDFVALELVNF
jgi:hypothetical protein